jgi:hypothetical protein
MATTPEGKVKEKIRAMFKQNGTYYTMPVMNGMATNGTPDFSVCHQGYYGAVEAKATAKDGPTELQWVRLGEVARAGGSTLVIHADNRELLERWLLDPSKRVLAIRSETSRRVARHVWL